jgi:hypothetical protein
MTESTHRLLGRIRLAALVFWGAVTTVSYFASPVHEGGMLNDAGKAFVESACMGRGALCNGIATVPATMVSTLARLAPFTLYAILSLLLLGGFVARSYMRDERWNLRVAFSPLAMLGLFVLSCWALLLSVSFGDNGGLPMNRVIEPTATVYPDVGPEALDDLRANFDELQDRGCLSPIGATVGGAQAYSYKFTCLQAGFATRVLTQMAMLLLVFFNVLVLGRAGLHALRLKGFAPLAEGVFSAGLGSCLLIAVLWLVAMVGVYTQAVGWILLVAIPAAGFVHSRYWARFLWSERWETDAKPWSLRVVIAWLLVTYLAFNFLNVVRPFPIGWDDLGRYMNQPRLLVSYGAFIPTLSTFSWEYLTSVGFLLFGYDSIFGATLSMLVNWSAGLLAVLSVLLFGRAYLGQGRGTLAALLYYTLPMVGHFSFADMKVDNAIFAVGTLSLLAGFLAAFPPGSGEEGDDAGDGAPVLWLLALAGILGGFAFGMKPTAIMTVMGAGAVILGARLGWAGMLGAAFLSLSAFVGQGTLQVAEVSGRVFGDASILPRGLTFAVLAVIGLAFLAYSLRSRIAALRPLATQVGVFLLAFVVVILPWIVVNNASYGRLPLRLELSHANALAPTLAIDGKPVDTVSNVVRELPPDLAVDTSNPACVSTSKEEELDRYWGDYHGAWHYLGLPWRAVMNIDTYGYYVTLFPGLLLVPLLLLVPYFWTRRGAWARLLLGATALMIVEWMFMANGIVWYGVGMFLGLVVLMEALVVFSPTAATRRTAGVLVALSLLTAYAHRLWQYDMMQNIFEYPMGKVSAATMEERTIPHYDDIRDEIERRIAATPDRPYVYRMGTFIPYFIPRNFEVLPVADNQLDMFNCLYQERDAALTLKRLQTLGFNSMIFDTNTQSIEKDVNGSLHKKVQAFVDFANTAGLGIQIAVNDPGAGIAYILLP